MADNHQADASAPAPRVYRGKPEKQRDSSAQNTWRAPKPKASGSRPPRPSPKTAPSDLPPPSRKAQNQNTELSDVSHPSTHSMFAQNITVFESAPNVSITPSAPAAIDISRYTYSELITDDSTLAKEILPEYLDYYTTACIWMRIVSLKSVGRHTLTDAEEKLLALIKSKAFSIPEPILLQIKQFGNVVSPVTGQTFEATFPELPTNVLGGHGGYFGPLLAPAAGVDDTTHNFYEELPCLGTLSSAVRATVSGQPPGPYLSAVTYQDRQPGENLLGFKPLGSRSPEAKAFATTVGITDQQFPSDPVNSGFNFDLIYKISKVLARTKTFKVTDVTFSTLAEIGSVSQLVMTKPLITPGYTCSRGEQRATSQANESLSTFGSAIFFNSQLYKESGANGTPNTWSVIPATQQHPIPAAWVANRNLRRARLPVQYRQAVFVSIAQLSTEYRNNIINQMVLVKR